MVRQNYIAHRNEERRKEKAFNDTATTEIYTDINTLSLHDALPILCDMIG